MRDERDGRVYEVGIEPLEPLLFGDNRSARVGVDHVLEDQDPSPLTVHGAIGRYLIGAASEPWPRAVLGAQQDDMLRPQGNVAELLGFCLQDAGGVRYFPKPLHLRCTRDRAGQPWPEDLLAPAAAERAAAWCHRSSSGDQRLLDAAPLDEAEGPLWASESTLGDVLCARLPEGGIRDPEGLYQGEPRPGIAIDNDTGTVIEAHFFTRPYRRFAPLPLDAGERARPGGLCAWLATLAPAATSAEPGVGYLGGDRRRARFRFRELGDARQQVLARCRADVQEAATGSEGFFLYLLTPAIAAPETDWRCAGQAPVARAVGKARYASGFDVAGCTPRAMLALLPEGSVFFYPWPAGADRGALIAEHWLGTLHDLGAAAGFGRTLVGVWS